MYFRHMLRTYFLDKSGMITGWGSPPTWRENISSCQSSGSTGSGGLTPTSRMPSKSPSKQWPSQTTMFGSIGRKKSFTWWSKFSFSHLVPMREMWLILRLTLLLSCSMKFSMYPFDEQHCHMSMESCKWRLVRFYQLSKHLPLSRCWQCLTPRMTPSSSGILSSWSPWWWSPSSCPS